MSAQKKRKSDIHTDQMLDAKKEKWYTEDEKVRMLNQPLNEQKDNSGRRSSFIGALKRMVSGPSMKDKSRHSNKFSAAQLPPHPSNLTENDNSFASETSQDSVQLSTEKLANNYTLRQFVQKGEAALDKSFAPSDISTSSGISDTTASSISVFSGIVTPSRIFRRETTRRPSVRSMPDASNLIAGVSLTGRRSVSVSSDLVGSPCSRGRFSMRLFKTAKDCEKIPESNEFKSRFIESFVNNKLYHGVDKIESMGKTSSASKVKHDISISDQIKSVNNILDDQSPYNTPKNSSAGPKSSPGSSGLQKRMSNAFNILRFKTSPSPGRGINRVQRAKTENPKKDHRIRKRTDQNNRRSSLVHNPGFHNMNTSLIEATLTEQALQKEREEAELFRKQTVVASIPIPQLLDTEQFDAIIVDVLDGLPASKIAKTILDYYSATQDIYNLCKEDDEKSQIIYCKDDKPALVCVKLESSTNKPLEVRVRVGVGSGLREVWNLKGIKRVLAYPMFCFNDEDYNNKEKCIDQFFTMVLHALDWNNSIDEVEFVMLSTYSEEHLRLLTEQYHLYKTKLPSPCVSPKTDFTEMRHESP